MALLVVTRAAHREPPRLQQLLRVVDFRILAFCPQARGNQPHQRRMLVRGQEGVSRHHHLLLPALSRRRWELPPQPVCSVQRSRSYRRPTIHPVGFRHHSRSHTQDTRSPPCQLDRRRCTGRATGTRPHSPRHSRLCSPGAASSSIPTTTAAVRSWPRTTTITSPALRTHIHTHTLDPPQAVHRRASSPGRFPRPNWRAARATPTMA